LSVRALNRALLARQLLLERENRSAENAIEHLVGLQGQNPSPPYFGLWARLRDFRTGELGALITDRRAVRIALMRSTIHLVTARDCLTLRPLTQPVQERNLFSGSPYGRQLIGLDLEKLLATARKLVEERPRSITELGMLLQAKWPDRDARSMAYACRNLLPLVQVPPRGVWGKSGLPLVTTAESWLGKPMSRAGNHDRLIHRYLAAFGPASSGDFQLWSGLTGMRERFEKLRAELVVFRDERGKELFDLPDAPRPEEDTPAPVRFLGEYDNVMLSHVDRSRIVPDLHRKLIASRNGQVPGTILVDGFVSGMWRIAKTRGSAVLEVQPFVKLSKQQRKELTEEGLALLDFAAGGTTRRNVAFATV
jgi:hypothetical protein